MASWVNDCAACPPSLLRSFSLTYGPLHIAQGDVHHWCRRLRSSLENHGRCGDGVETGDLPPASLTSRGSCSELPWGCCGRGDV